MDMERILTQMMNQIEELEKEIYYFNSVLKPRHEVDETILVKFKKNYLEVEELKKKIDSGEQLSEEEINKFVPVELRDVELQEGS